MGVACLIVLIMNRRLVEVKPRECILHSDKSLFRVLIHSTINKTRHMIWVKKITRANITHLRKITPLYEHNLYNGVIERGKMDASSSN